jgi:PBP1b-binding outer membrane lipoprotein LpoB
MRLKEKGETYIYKYKMVDFNELRKQKKQKIIKKIKKVGNRDTAYAIKKRQKLVKALCKIGK